MSKYKRYCLLIIGLYLGFTLAKDYNVKRAHDNAMDARELALIVGTNNIEHKKAKQAYLNAAKEGDAYCQYIWAQWLFETLDNYSPNSIKWYKKAARQHKNTNLFFLLSFDESNDQRNNAITEAQYMLGNYYGGYHLNIKFHDEYYYEGKDLSKAIYWYKKALSNGKIDAEERLNTVQKALSYRKKGIQIPSDPFPLIHTR